MRKRLLYLVLGMMLAAGAVSATQLMSLSPPIVVGYSPDHGKTELSTFYVLMRGQLSVQLCDITNACQALPGTNTYPSASGKGGIFLGSFWQWPDGQTDPDPMMPVDLFCDPADVSGNVYCWQFNEGYSGVYQPPQRIEFGVVVEQPAFNALIRNNPDPAIRQMFRKYLN